MSEHHKLSLTNAILININIMLGVGLFINTVELAQRAGSLGFLSYGIIGLLLLPLILSIAELVSLHPSGGFYIFARREINPFFGFLTAWIYFTGKLASSAIMIHTAVLILQHFIPLTAHTNPLAFDMLILFIFIGFNMLNMKAGSAIQASFTILKATVITCAVMVGFFLFNVSHFASPLRVWTGIPSTLPLVLYAAMGFEAACVLSSRIEDARRNAPRAILISFIIVISILLLYQLAFFGALGPALSSFSSYRQAFPTLMQRAISNSALAHNMGYFLNIAIACSALGGAYGILFSNSWNLYAIAQHHHIPFARTIATFNRHAIPYACVLIEGLLCGLYLIISQGNQVPLQATSALAAALTYSLSVIALVRAKRKIAASTRSSWTTWLGLGSCSLLIAACIKGLIKNGIGSLYLFIGLLILGVFFFLTTPGRYLEEEKANGAST